MAKITEQFEDFKLNKQLLTAVKELHYEKPTPVQQKAIPLISAGHDLLGIAQTGTGKTAAYLLPLLMKVKYAQGLYPRALILAPTKELVIQIDENVKQFSTYLDIRHLPLYGGIGPKTQIEILESGVDILISTPGRFLDLYRRGAIVTQQIRTLVLDEADRMFDMGFHNQIRDILEKIPVKRQNLLFSATFPEKVQQFSDDFLDFPEKVEITPQSTAAESVKQFYYFTPNMATKIHLLQFLLSGPDLNRVMVFVKKKETANNIYKFLRRKMEGEVRVIHANKGQNSRINAIDDFRSGTIRVLVSTDVASRGLDIYEVSHVINFDVPVIYEDYIHRIGRTGRADKKGDALTFANKAELMHLKKIEYIIRESIRQLPLPVEITVAPTDAQERKEIEMEIDKIRKRDDPGFKGAFHEKKKKPAPHIPKQKRRRKK